MYSQDYEPSQRKFVWNGIPRYLNADMDYFKQKDFLLGWHWNDLYKIKDCSALVQQRSCDLFVAGSILFGFQAA